jgi:Glycerol uptake facilitator and related permeases (Major Intrinsic Protein Family)
METLKKALAECVGTMVLVVIGCGVAMSGSVDTLGIAVAFGLALIAMAYSIGNVSGCHINPAVSLGMVIAHKMSFKDFGIYVASQVVGAVLGALILEGVYSQFFASSASSAYLGSDMVSSILGGATSTGFILGLIVEVVLTFIFVLTILGVTSKTDNKAVAGLIIGLTLTAVHLLGIPLTGTSVNPARSIGPALIAMLNGHFEPIKESWIFIVGPLAGAALAGLLFNFFDKKKVEKAIGLN